MPKVKTILVSRFYLVSVGVALMAQGRASPRPKARAAGAEYSAPESVTGRDGKQYPSKRQRAEPPRYAPLRLRCSSCGITADARCDCGAPYVVAGVLAQQAVVQFPEKSNCAIAEELGISEATVRRARNTGSSNDEPEKRIGRDGKQYPSSAGRFYY